MSFRFSLKCSQTLKRRHSLTVIRAGLQLLLSHKTLVTVLSLFYTLRIKLQIN